MISRRVGESGAGTASEVRGDFAAVAVAGGEIVGRDKLDLGPVEVVLDVL